MKKADGINSNSVKGIFETLATLNISLFGERSISSNEFMQEAHYSQEVRAPSTPIDKTVGVFISGVKTAGRFEYHGSSV